MKTYGIFGGIKLEALFPNTSLSKLFDLSGKRRTLITYCIYGLNQGWIYWGGGGGEDAIFHDKAKNIRDKMRYSHLNNNIMLL